MGKLKLFVIVHSPHAVRPAEQSIQLLIGAEQQLLLYHTINLKTWSLLSKDNQSRSWKKVGIQC